GWGGVLVSTFLIDHFELFGLTQTVSYAMGRPHKPPTFKERLLDLPPIGEHPRCGREPTMTLDPQANTPRLEIRACFDRPSALKVGGKLGRCQVPERAVWPIVVVVAAPGFDLLPGVVEREELMHVQALVAQASVEGFDEGVLHGLARSDEVELHATLI